MGARRAVPLLLALELIAIARAVPIDRRSTPSDREVSARDSPEEDLEKTSKMEHVPKDERCMIFAGRNCRSKQQMWTITDDEKTTTKNLCAQFYCATRASKTVCLHLPT